MINEAVSSAMSEVNNVTSANRWEMMKSKAQEIYPEFDIG